ncbi:MAG: signal recognition particle-docking protein FtsY [Gammaproteobacteria bacterium]|nr:signal recognition particle-docking protein FtsY [Gammaproteobacteria bacterium]
MLRFLKSNKDQNDANPEKTGLFARLRSGLKRTRHQLTDGLSTLFLGKKVIDATLLTDIETQLLLADVGMEVCTSVIKQLTQQIAREDLNDPQQLLLHLKNILADVLKPCSAPLILNETQKPTVILMVGVNGSGKTTTIGKLAKKFTDEGKQVMLAAGDTFRAAAVEQLQVWGQRNNVPVISQQPGADSASVIFDALQAAQARGVDILIADTAGRLQSQTHLMEELKKIKRVLTKLDPNAPHEVMLVLDATVGQNGLQQAKLFFEAVKVSGITLTKLDGTAKGGIIFAIAKQLATPIRFIGVGESAEDLQVFDSNAFIEALFTPQSEEKHDSV